MTQVITSYEIWGVFTPLLLSGLVLCGLLLELTFFKDQPRALGRFMLAGFLIVLLGQWYVHFYRLKMAPAPVSPFGGQYTFDVFGQIFNYIFLIAAAVTASFSLTHFEDREDHRGEFYLLLAIAAIGACLMASANHLLILFVGLETMSISIYVLVGMERNNPRSNEAALKYLLMGAFASALLLYGMALIYGLTGQLDYREISKQISLILPENMDFTFTRLGVLGGELLIPKMTLTGQSLALMFGVVLVLAGLFFKVAAVPFHAWTPDVYEGAPAPVTAFMATAVKAAAFAALVRLAMTVQPLWGIAPLYVVLYVLAVLTMTLGNFVAIAQRNLKRMLAYSSIAHAGYLLVGVTTMVAAGQFLSPKVVGGDPGFQSAWNMINISASSILFYLLSYLFMNLGAFGVIVIVGAGRPGAETLEGFAGLAKRRPGLAAVMAICMLSLAGVPPLAGFTAKFYVFSAAVNCRLYLLAVIGVLNSVVSAYFYLRVLVVMYMEPEPEPRPGLSKSAASSAALFNVLMAAAVVVIGVFPNLILLLIAQAFKPEMANLIVH